MLTVMVGLPRSGKTTQVKQMQSDGAVRVSPDCIRLALHGQRYIASAEPVVWAVAQTMVRALFRAGHSWVVIDGTNTTRKRRAIWLSPEWDTQFCLVKTPTHECVARAAGDDELITVIERMARQFEPPNPEIEKWLD